MNKLKEICAKVVCDQEEEGTDDHGRLKKKVEEGGKLTKGKKMKANVKYTEWKPTATTSKSVDKVTISSDEELGEESCSLGEENFSTLTSYDGHEQRGQIWCKEMRGSNERLCTGYNEVFEGPIQQSHKEVE